MQQAVRRQLPRPAAFVTFRCGWHGGGGCCGRCTPLLRAACSACAGV
jgi:hypothetical protein